jgi:hypothetical protein
MHDDVKRFAESGGIRVDDPLIRSSIETVLGRLPNQLRAALLAPRPFADERTGEEGLETDCVIGLDEAQKEDSTTHWRPLLVKRGQARLLFNPRIASYGEERRVWIIAREVARYYLGHQEFGATSEEDEPARLAEEWGFMSAGPYEDG